MGPGAPTVGPMGTEIDVYGSAAPWAAQRPSVRPPPASDGSGLVIVCEQCAEVGGTERVIGALARAYPRATLIAPDFVGVDGRSGGDDYLRSRVRTAWRGGALQHYLLPLYSRRIRRLDLGGAAVVLSMASHGWSLAARPPSGARHLTYHAGPSPSLYTRRSWYLRAHPPLARPLARAAMPALRAHSRRLLHGTDRVLVPSGWSAAEIARLGGRDGEVLHPPVRTDFFTPAGSERRHLLFVARLVPHKRPEAVIEAFRSLRDELVVVGDGPLLQRLREAAPRNVRFTGHVDDRELRELYRSSRALVCPSVEEFGIVMAEAHACGAPVIAPRNGGALDIVRDGETGILLDRVDASSLAAAVRGLGRRSFDPGACRASAERFSEWRFLARFDQVLGEELGRVSH